MNLLQLWHGGLIIIRSHLTGSVSLTMSVTCHRSDEHMIEGNTKKAIHMQMHVNPLFSWQSGCEEFALNGKNIEVGREWWKRVWILAWILLHQGNVIHTQTQGLAWSCHPPNVNDWLVHCKNQCSGSFWRLMFLFLWSIFTQAIQDWSYN